VFVVLDADVQRLALPRGERLRELLGREGAFAFFERR
jgi:hypothetical protein